jgi:hypothetical protein
VTRELRELFGAFWMRFEWSVFSNVQLWEHFAGVVCLCFDAKRELADVAVNEPLALYWLVRAFLLDESDVFGEAERHAMKSLSPLVQSVAAATRRRWDSRDETSGLVMRRKEIAKLGLPRKAKWSKGVSAQKL